MYPGLVLCLGQQSVKHGSVEAQGTSQHGVIISPVIPLDLLVAREIEASLDGGRGMLHPCFWLAQYPVSTSSPADSCTSGAVIACLDCLAPLLRVFLDIHQNTNTSTGVADGFVLRGGPDHPQSAPAPPIQAGREVREQRIISALAVLQQKASDDTSLGIDQKPNGRPADVWSVSQHPAQQFLTTSSCISLMILALCCLLITTRWTSVFNLYFIACSSKISLLLPAIFISPLKREV